MQLIETLYVFLISLIGILFLDVLYLKQKKFLGFLLVFIISIAFFLIPGLFSFLGTIFLWLFLFSNKKSSKIDHLVFSFLFFVVGSIEFLKNLF